MLKYIFFALGFSLVLACDGRDEEPINGTILIESSIPSDQDVVYTLSIDEDQNVDHFKCPSDIEIDSLRFGLIKCTQKNVLLERYPQVFNLSVKSKGYEFFYETINKRDFTNSRYSLKLKSLSSFNQNDDWSNGFTDIDIKLFRDFAFRTQTELGPASVVKFYIREFNTNDPKIYFQNTAKHPLHYNFARNVLGIPLTASEFEKQTYHGEDRVAIAGTLVFYENLESTIQSIDSKLKSPIALTFFGRDELSASMAMRVQHLLEARLGFAKFTQGVRRLFYLPSGETRENDIAAAQFEWKKRDSAWATRKEIYGSLKQQTLNPGVAYGVLRRLSVDDLEKEVLSFGDIVLLTHLPNELPIVGGVITEELQTPLAHVNVASRARGTPNLALLDAPTNPKIGPFLGKLVRFEVKANDFSIEETTNEEAIAYWQSQKRERRTLTFDDQSQGLPAYRDLKFADSQKVGAKTANIAELSQLLGEHAPIGFGVPFFYYTQFMNENAATNALCQDAETDCRSESRSDEICAQAKSWCEENAAETSSFQEYAFRIVTDDQLKTDTKKREAVLDGLRHQIRHTPVRDDFAALLDARVREIFSTAKVRLRSSTNAEDLKDFSGAGLYKSVSAYGHGNDLASLDIRKVWASVWNWRAYEERSFWNIDHMSVKMGVNVNQAFSDEAANGVAITQNIADPLTSGIYVNVQLGEASVTNPDDGSLPEIISLSPDNTGQPQVARWRYSSLSPNTPVLRDSEIATLFETTTKIQNHFSSLYNKDPYAFVLELEFKFYGPERRFVVKQVRPYLESSPRK